MDKGGMDFFILWKKKLSFRVLFVLGFEVLGEVFGFRLVFSF